ncbi:MAG: S-adenosylmethionine-dependent methyltransferase [Bogoriella megaspora]|nr:MAG: S-adenosylmethionine-dependent methyltransferase [Bogoriella megaspora]
MLPTPSTRHVPFDRVYEPAEDSFLLLDTLSSPPQTEFLHQRFACRSDSGACPLIVEIGTGSGVVLAFLTAHAQELFGRSDVLSLGTDISSFACSATRETVANALQEADVAGLSKAVFLDAMDCDLGSALHPKSVDVLIFNPPYVPTEALPNISQKHEAYNVLTNGSTTFEQDSHLLELSYAGGKDGMEVTERLLSELPTLLTRDRGVAYVLLCKQNRPDAVESRIRGWGAEWQVETVGRSGMKGGWEKLQILRIWRVSE